MYYAHSKVPNKVSHLETWTELDLVNRTLSGSQSLDEWLIHLEVSRGCSTLTKFVTGYWC